MGDYHKGQRRCASVLCLDAARGQRPLQSQRGRKKSDIERYFAKSGDAAQGLPVIVLIDAGSAVDGNPDDIAVATGFCKEQLESKGFKTWNNELFDKTNMVETLFCAKEFMDEESDLIINIGTWVLQEACRHIKQIQSMELPKTFEKLSINVSAKQFSQGNFKHLVKKSIAETGISPSLLGVEITENLLINQIHETIELITELKAMGITCSIDDFGTGYSSLTYLKRIPVEMIKIDREFVTNLHNDSEARSIAQLIISLGKTLGREILAEGVETKEELECLINLGCYKFQGYYFAKPMPFNEFIERLSTSANQPKLN